jgi:flagellar motor switch/type III secretory pathway protein FliN
VIELKGRKVTVAVTVEAEGEVVAKGEVIAVEIPDRLMKSLRKA